MIKKKRNVRIWVLPYDEAKKFFPLYDTFEIVPVIAKSRIEFELLKTAPEQLLKKSLELAKKIKNKIKYITKENVKYTLMLFGFDGIWTDSVHFFLKNFLHKL